MLSTKPLKLKRLYSLIKARLGYESFEILQFGTAACSEQKVHRSCVAIDKLLSVHLYFVLIESK